MVPAQVSAKLVLGPKRLATGPVAGDALYKGPQVVRTDELVCMLRHMGTMGFQRFSG